MFQSHVANLHRLTHNMIRTIKAETTFGGSAGSEANGGVTKNGFNISLSCDMESAPETNDEIVSEGFRSLLYRGGASHLLSLYPKGTKSSDIVFEADMATKFATTLTKWFVDKCPNKRGVEYLKHSRTVEISVTEYELGSGAEPKFAKVKAFLTEWLAADKTRTVEAFATKRTLPVPVEVAAEGDVPAKTWQDDMEFLAAANTWYAAKMKAVAAAMAAAE